ncbi:MAG: class I SAM-dependent methyltransferase [Candidatus Heimdallarchaeota archaeon]
MKIPKIIKKLGFWCIHPRYAFNRAKDNRFRKKNPEAPWLTEDAIIIIEELAKKDWFCFEWGSGRSTVWFANRIEKIVSLEHDEVWFNKISNVLETNEIHNVKHKLAKISEFEESHISKPIFNDYTDAILHFPDQSFDCILVDGRNRNACLVNAIPKLKSGGYLILDNAERSYDVSSLSDWKLIKTTNGIWNTFIWEKP